MKKKLIRITTIPLSLEKLLEGQLTFMNTYFDVIAISSEKERLKTYGENNNVRTFFVSLTRKITPIKDLVSVYQLFRFLQKEKPEIVHTHTPKAGIVGMLAAKLAGVPMRLHTVAGLPLMEATGVKRKLLDFVEKLTYACATRVYPNSKGLYDFILENTFAPPAKVKIIGQGSSNGIDTSYFDPALFPKEQNAQQRRALGIPADAFVFVFVGRLVGDKGINELVAAFTQLQSQSTTEANAYILLVGPLETDLDPLRPETLHQIETHPHIKAVGYQQDVRPFFGMSDALVFPSYREGFPNVVMQAGAMGLPAIVSDINGCNEIISHGENGIIVPVKETVALLGAMQQLIKDLSLYTKMKENSRKKIVTTYQREEVWKALLKEYDVLLTAKQLK